MSDVPNRSLRDALRAEFDRNTTDPGCLDAGTLAAWSDGTLSGRSRSVAEAHAASCARCQALLAAMVRTAPPPEEASAAWWRRLRLAWLAPIVATATVVAIWISVPRPFRSSTVVPPATSVAANPEPPMAAFKEPEAAPPPAPASAPKPARAPAAARSMPRARESAKGRLDDAAESRAERVGPAPPSAAPAPPIALGAASPRFETLASAQARPVGIEVLSPDSSVRWLLMTGGRVGRSTDGGATWQTQATGLTRVTAASAPTPEVLWVVGPSGGVAMTADGRTWQRVSFPEFADLTAVVASDAKSAVVATADGRRLATADGGVSWR